MNNKEKETTVLQKKLLKSVNNLNKENQNHVLNFSQALANEKINYFTISLASSWLGNQPDKRGSYYVKIISVDNNESFGNVITHTTAQRLLLKGLLEAIRMLPVLCTVTIFTPNRLGFKTEDSINVDLLSEIKSIAKNNKIVYIEKIKNDNQLKLKCKELLMLNSQ